MNRLILLVESRIRGDVYVRFGGELPKTHRSNTAGRWMLSLHSKYNKERLPTFAQVDLRIDKTFYLKHCMLGFYLDLQNITASKLKQQDVLMSTGIIENPEAPADSQHYKMKRLKQSSGTLLPTLGITFEY